MESAALVVIDFDPRLLQQSNSRVAILQRDVILSGIDPEKVEGLAGSAVLRNISVFLFIECIGKPA